MELKDVIQKEGKVSSEIRLKYFYGKSYSFIRDWMEQEGLDRHTAIDLVSTEICIVTPQGILLQERSSDNGLLGMWGGTVNDGELPVKGALRELYEETKILVEEKDLEFVEIDEHDHVYSNGDKAHFRSYRYVLRLREVPNIQIDSESNGFQLVRESVPDESTSRFIRRFFNEFN